MMKGDERGKNVEKERKQAIESGFGLTSSLWKIGN